MRGFIELSDYSKAYYNKEKRKKARIEIESVNEANAKFIWKTDSRQYLKIFEGDMSPLIGMHLDRFGHLDFLVAKSSLGIIKAVAVIDMKGYITIVGDFHSLEYTDEQLRILENRGIYVMRGELVE